jgi:hypothetical protein
MVSKIALAAAAGGICEMLYRWNRHRAAAIMASTAAAEPQSGDLFAALFRGLKWYSSSG